MIEIFGYKFAERWADLSPRYAEYDEFQELTLAPFAKMHMREAETTAVGTSPDGNPIEVQRLMVSGPVLMGYCNDLIGRINGLIQEQKKVKSRARAAAMATMEAKSEAERERKLSVIPEVQSAEWAVADLEHMRDHLENKFKVLKESVQNWRAVFYGTQVERKSQAPINAPTIGGPREA